MEIGEWVIGFAIAVVPECVGIGLDRACSRAVDAVNPVERDDGIDELNGIVVEKQAIAVVVSDGVVLDLSGACGRGGGRFQVNAIRPVVSNDIIDNQDGAAVICVDGAAGGRAIP